MADNKVKAALKNPFELDEEATSTSQKVAVKTKEGDKEVLHEESYEESYKDGFNFKRYKPLYEISSKIAEELNGYAYRSPANFDANKASYRDIMEKGYTFFMTDTGFKRTGLLSLFPALSTGIKLYSEISKMSKKSESESKAQTDLLQKIKSGIEAVFKFIYRPPDDWIGDYDWRKNSNRKPVFDASPYESEAFYPGSDPEGLEGRSYIDSISWGVDLFFKIINLDKNKGPVFDEEYRKEAKKLIEWCLQYVNDAVLTIADKDEDEKSDDKDYNRPVGWNFSKINASPQNAKARSSLYFTYSAASMYLSFYSEYKDLIDNVQTLNRAYSTLKEAQDKGEILLENFKSAEDAIKIHNLKQAKEVVTVYASALKDKANELWKAYEALERYDKENKDKLDEYYFFNKNRSAEYNGKIYTVPEIKSKSLGPVSRLKWNLEKISTDIWKQAKELLEDKFVYDDFSFKEATTDAIQSGGQTNALFAGLLQISICLYSKYDFVVFYTEDKKGSGMFGKKAYDDMQNTMLLHVQKVQRFFDKLSKESKAFGVDSLILRFPENFSNEDKEGKLTDREMAERLRKQLIRITSLTPMLLRTNNLISQYVVQFPQKQMGEALVKIGEKRFYDRNRKTEDEDENKKYRWFWESDGYHAMSNYYYVGAIFDFYAYYRDYEEKFITDLDGLKEKLINGIKYKKSVQRYYQEITDEMAELEEKHKKELDDMEAKLAEAKKSEKDENIGKELVSNIRIAVESAIVESGFLKNIIKGLREQLAKEVFERYSKDSKGNEEDLKKLKKPVEPEDGSLFSLLQALAADIILQSAIKQKTNLKREVDDLGDFSGFKPAKVALIGGKQLIKGNKGNKYKGLINKLFADTFNHVEWDKIQETEQEKEK